MGGVSLLSVMSDIPSAVRYCDLCQISCFCIRFVMSGFLTYTGFFVPFFNSVCSVDFNRIKFLHLFFPRLQNSFIFSDDFACLDTFVI